MTSDVPTGGERAFHGAGLEWFVAYVNRTSPGGFEVWLQDRLASFAAAWQTRFPGNIRADVSRFISGFDANPRVVSAFVQALPISSAPDMHVMVWRLIHGCEIESLDVRYLRVNAFEMQVRLVTPYGQVDAPDYTSQSVADFGYLRHIGISEMGGKPFLDGFYARLGSPS